MELTSFNLKLSELKEYEQAKQERQEANKPAGTSDTQQISSQPLPTTFKWQKSEKEIRERIGLNITDNP